MHLFKVGDAGPAKKRERPPEGPLVADPQPSRSTRSNLEPDRDSDVELGQVRFRLDRFDLDPTVF